jgi:hypothetical protein
MNQSNAWRMIERLARAASIRTRIGNHSFPRDRDHGVSEKRRQA